jgi:tetratricopeptide (TPR) repeat protein
MKPTSMHPLSDEDRWLLQRSDGYLDLSMPDHARGLLGQVSEAGRKTLPYQQVRLRQALVEKDWPQATELARRLTREEPFQPAHWVDLAFATRRSQGIEQARSILRAARKFFPTEAVISFNLACYECQLGHHDKALGYLRAAEKLAPKCREMALEDEDLKPLWPRLDS